MKYLSDSKVTVLWATLLALLAAALYVTTAVPGPFDGDSGEFQYMPRVLGLPHPTGYPLYLLLGWLWSWLPIGTSLAHRMNLFSAFWAVITLLLLFLATRQQGLTRIAGLCAVLALALLAPFWRYAGVAAVYTFHAALLMAAILAWWRWSAAVRYDACSLEHKQESATAQSGQAPTTTPRSLWVAALLTGLALTNHPTAFFIVPAALLFVLSHFIGRGPRPRFRWREWLIAGLLFAACGLLYLYVPIRLWGIGPGTSTYGLQEPIARGLIAPFLQWNWPSVLDYITGRSLMATYSVDLALLPTRLPTLLLNLLGPIWTIFGLIGTVVHLRRDGRGWLLLAALFLPAAAAAVSYDAEFESRNQIANFEGHLMPALLCYALWIAFGVHRAWGIITSPKGARRHLPEAAIALLLLASLTGFYWGKELPTQPKRTQSDAIRRYWTEVLSYPLEEGAAVTGHWGDLTAFWYFQRGEGLRPDLWAIFPPNRDQIAAWMRESDRPLYLAGPLLEWAPELNDQYELTPWGILVRIGPEDVRPEFPPLIEREVRLGEIIELKGYTTTTPAPGRQQLWLAWETEAPTPRDLMVSLRLTPPNGATIQQDGRLASLWYPDSTLREGQEILTVFDLALPADLPPATRVAIVLYDPATGTPLLSRDGQEVIELGEWQPAPGDR